MTDHELEVAVAQKCKKAADAMAEAMNEAAELGVEVGFNGILRTGKKNRFEVVGFIAKKDLLYND